MKTIKFANDAEQILRITIYTKLHASKIKLSDIAEECDIKEAYIKNWLSHKKPITLTAFLSIARVLKINFEFDSTDISEVCDID